MIEIQTTLLSFAEVAITLAGFSAIVVVIRRNTQGQWNETDAHQFMGMVVHSVFAVVFCMIPTVIDVVVQDTVTSMHIACALLGAQIIVHCLAVMMSPTADAWTRVSLGIGMLFGVVQFGVFTDWGVQRELQLYIAGIIWHILQAGVLFVMLVWIPRGSIAEEAATGGRGDEEPR